MRCDAPSNCVFLLPYHCTGAQAAVFFPPDPLQAQRTGIGLSLGETQSSQPHVHVFGQVFALREGTEEKRRGGRGKTLLKTLLYLYVYTSFPNIPNNFVTRLIEKQPELTLKSILCPNVSLLNIL